MSTHAIVRVIFEGYPINLYVGSDGYFSALGKELTQGLKLSFNKGKEYYQRNCGLPTVDISDIGNIAYDYMMQYMSTKSLEVAKKYTHDGIYHYAPIHRLDCDIQYLYILDFDHNTFYGYETDSIRHADDSVSPWYMEGEKGYEPMLPWYAQMCAYTKKKQLLPNIGQYYPPVKD